MKLAESDRSVMEVFWERGPMFARDVATELNKRLGWSKTTTYTMLTRCVAKGYLSRSEPKFLCKPLLTREQVANEETETLLCNHFSGSADLLVAALVGQQKLNAAQIKELYELLRQMEETCEP